MSTVALGGSLRLGNSYTVGPLTPSGTVVNQQNGFQLLYDNFTDDTSLNTNIWQINGPLGNTVGSLMSSPPSKIVNPTLTFSSAGMAVSGADNYYEAATIQSTHAFAPPFTAEASVIASIGHGTPFVFVLSSAGGSERVAINGHLNSESWCSGSDGISVGWPNGLNTGGGGMMTDQPVSSAALNVPYQLVIQLNPSGYAVIVVNSRGLMLGSAESEIGQGPFYVLLAQGEGYPN